MALFADQGKIGKHLVPLSKVCLYLELVCVPSSLSGASFNRLISFWGGCGSSLIYESFTPGAQPPLLRLPSVVLKTKVGFVFPFVGKSGACEKFKPGFVPKVFSARPCQEVASDVRMWKQMWSSDFPPSHTVICQNVKNYCTLPPLVFLSCRINCGHCLYNTNKTEVALALSSFSENPHLTVQPRFPFWHTPSAWKNGKRGACEKLEELRRRQEMVGCVVRKVAGAWKG